MNTSQPSVEIISHASERWADTDSEWTAKAALSVLRRGGWIEPGGPSGYMLIDPKQGFVILSSEFFLKRRRHFRLQWWRAGWGNSVRKTCKCRYVYDPKHKKATAPAKPLHGHQ